MAKYKVAYGNKDDIDSTISGGKIPPGTIILTKDSNEMYFYDLDCNLRAYQEKYKFTSKEEAETWVSKYDCRGEILSVHEGNVCNIYLVDYEGNLNSINASNDTVTEEDLLSFLTDLEIVTPITTEYGELYTTETGEVYIL